MTRHGARFSPMMLPLVQMPFFIFFFLALRDLAAWNPELLTGGTLWFPDLSASDSLARLPILTSALMLATLELGTEGGGTQSPLMKFVFRGVGLLMIPLTMSFPSAVHLYWSASSGLSLLQFLIVKTKPIAKLLKLDPLPSLSEVVTPAKPAVADTAKLVTHKKRKH